MNIFTKSLLLIVFLWVWGFSSLSLKAQGTITLQTEGFYKAQLNGTPSLFKVFYSFDTGALAGTEIFCTDVVSANQGYVSFPSSVLNIPYAGNPPNSLKLIVQEWAASPSHIFQYQDICLGTPGSGAPCDAVWCNVVPKVEYIVDFTTIAPGYTGNIDFQLGGTGMRANISYDLPANVFQSDTDIQHRFNSGDNFTTYDPNNIAFGTGHCYNQNSKEFRFLPVPITLPNYTGISYVWEYRYIVLNSPAYTSPWIQAGTSISDLIVGDIFEMPSLLNELYTQYHAREKLLNPILNIKVTMYYGPSSSFSSNGYVLTKSVNLNYPPSVTKPQVPTFAQNNTAITAFNQAVSDSPSMTVEHIKCKKPTEKGKIILKNPQGLAQNYTVYIRNQEGFVANKNMDFRTDPATTYSFDNLAAGEYEIIIENFGIEPNGSGGPSYILNGCYSESVSVYVNEPATTFSATATPVVKASTGGKHISCFGASDGEIVATPSGGVANYYYKLFQEQGTNNWVLIATENNKATAHTFSGLSAGNYQVVIQDVFQTASCEETKLVTLVEPTQINASVLGVQQYEDAISGVDYDIKNFGGSQTIFILPTGGSPDYNVTLGASTLPATTVSSASFTLASGTYPYSIVDATTTCQRNFVIALTQPLDISLASQSITPVSCNGGSDGVISGTPQGGIRSLDYYTYILSKPSQAGFNMTDDGIDFSFSGLTAGTYELKVEDRYATSKTYSFVVTEPTIIAMLTTTGHKPFVSCFGGSDAVIAFNVSGGTAPYNYEYSSNGGASWSGITSTSSNITLTGLVAGNYEIRLKDSKGCFNQDASGYIRQTITISAPSSALSLVLTPEHLLCKGDNSGKIYLAGLGGWGGYTFFDVVTNAPVSNTITGLSAGTYQYKIRDLRGCEQTASITLTEPNELVGSSITTSPTLCYGESSGSVSVVVSGGTAPYQISVDGGVLQAYSSGNTIGGLLAGNHSLRLVDANVCEKTYNFSITDAPQINISTLSQTPASCGASDGAVSVSVSGGTGGYSYTWRNSSNTVVGGNSNVLTGVSSGTYTVTIKDANNCEKQYVAVVPSADGPQGIVSVLQTVSCFGGNDGVASISITQGTAPYSVLWSNGQTSTNVTTTATMSGLVGGSQLVQITDASGCIQPVSFSISQPASAVGVNTTSITQPTCNGANNGSISIVGTGGTAPYSYLWLDDNSTTSTRSSLKAGTYSVVITDSKGCKITQSITLTEPTPVVASFSESIFTICPNQTLSLDAGNAGSTYVWKQINNTTPISSTQQTLITEAGDYELVITTPAGCVGTKLFSVNISNDALKAEFLAATEIEVGDTLVTIDVTNPAPSEVVWSYDVSNPAIQRIDNQSIPYYAYFTFSEAGTYVITMQVKLFGCASTLQKTIQVKPKSGRVANAGLGYQGAGEISKVLVYPNPSAGVFQTKVELVSEAPMEVMLYGLQNRESYFKQSFSGAKEYNVQVNMPDLPAGYYILVFKTPQMTKTQQIIISR